MTRIENVFWDLYDFLAEHSPVIEAVGAIVSIIVTVERLIRRSLVVATILGLVACMFVFAILIRVSIRRIAEKTIRHRILLAFGAFLLVAIVITVGLWGVRKWQYPLFPPATGEEILVVVAGFEDRAVQRDLEARRLIVDRISSDLTDAQLESVRLEKAPTIEGDTVEAARKIGKRYRADIVIWGWYDDAGFWSNFAITRPESPPTVNWDVQPSSHVIAPGTPISISGTFSITGGEYLSLRDLKIPGEPIVPDTFGLYIVDKLPAQMSYLSLFTIAQIYYQDEQFVKALELLDTAIDRSREGGISTHEERIRNSLALAWFYKGVIHSVVQGEENEALQAYNQAINLGADLAYLYNNRGAIYTKRGQYELALADYNEAVRLSPEVSLYRANRGEVHMSLRDYRNAILDFDYALEDVGHPLLYYDRGNAHKYLGEYEQAIDDLTRAIEMSPDFEWAYNSRGDAYVEVEEYDLAFEDFDRARQLEPHWALPYVNAGDAYLQLSGSAQVSYDQCPVTQRASAG